MSRWTQVVAVALAAVVGVVPVFAQLSYAQALPEPISVLPLGEELADERLSEAEGAVAPLIPYFVAAGLIGVLAGVRSCTREKFSDTGNAILDGITAAVSFTVGALAGQWSSSLSGFTFIPQALPQGLGGGGGFYPWVMY